jgi:hypothetical protein
MIKKKVNSVEINKEIETAQLYTVRYKYIILNEFVNHMRLYFQLSYTYDRANDLLHSLGHTRKRIAFENDQGIKQSKNEFINDQGLNKNKPIVSKSKKKEEIVDIISRKVLIFIKDNFFDISYKNGIYNFNMYNSDEGIILLFDSKSLKAVLKEIIDVFSYDEQDIPMLVSAIKKLSEQSFIRENTYNETSIRVEDKRFYKYLFKGEN